MAITQPTTAQTDEQAQESATSTPPVAPANLESATTQTTWTGLRTCDGVSQVDTAVDHRSTQTAPVETCEGGCQVGGRCDTLESSTQTDTLTEPEEEEEAAEFGFLLRKLPPDECRFETLPARLKKYFHHSPKSIEVGSPHMPSHDFILGKNRKTQFSIFFINSVSHFFIKFHSKMPQKKPDLFRRYSPTKTG